MQIKRCFATNVSKEEALARADALLLAYKYRRLPGDVSTARYERSFPYASGFAFAPRQLHSMVTLWPATAPNGSSLLLDCKVSFLGQTPSRLFKSFFRGEMEDLEEYVTTGRQPQFDRAAQNIRATVINTIVALLSLVALVIAMTFAIVSGYATPVAFIFGLIALVGTTMLCAVLPLKPAHKPLTKELLPTHPAPPIFFEP